MARANQIEELHAESAMLHGEIDALSGLAQRVDVDIDVDSSRWCAVVSIRKVVSDSALTDKGRADLSFQHCAIVVLRFFV